MTANVNTGSNSKGELIGRLLNMGRGAPTFEVQESGPPHERIFRVEVSVDGQVLGTGVGRSKKEAERIAAEEALATLTVPSKAAAGSRPRREAAPWPIYSAVLAQAVEAALEFAPQQASLEDVQRSAAQFYRDLLADLGHGPEQ